MANSLNPEDDFDVLAKLERASEDTAAVAKSDSKEYEGTVSTEGVTEVMDALGTDEPSRFKYGEDSGVIKSVTGGYKLGAKPENPFSYDE